MVAVAPLDEPTLLLRVVEVRDAGRTARLHLEALPGGFFVSLGPRFLRAYHRTFLTSPAGIALLAERDATTGVLSHMAVDAAHRGDGVGAVLLDAFVDTAKAQGARSIRLSTAANNVAAQRFYERHGWQSGGQQTDADGQRWFHYGRRLR